MRRSTRKRGVTLIELMLAMAILLVGVLGLLGAQMASSGQNAAASRQNRATALAREVLGAVEQWQYNDVRLTNSTANDGAQLYSGTVAAPTPSDFELDLDSTAAAGAAAALPASKVDFDGDGNPDYRRFLHLAAPTDAAVLGLRVSAVVYWREAAGWRRVVLHGLKYDPAGNKAAVSGL